MSKVSFQVGLRDHATADACAKRAIELGLSGRGKWAPLHIHMDLVAVKANGMPELDFGRLLNSSGQDFAHDIVGIERNLNRQTGKLENCFVPRAAR